MGSGLEGSATGSGPNYIFVTSTAVPLGQITSGSAADAICTGAASGHLPGSYVAWVSTPTKAAKDRLGAAQGWIRPDGKPFASSLPDLVAGRILYPPRITELVSDVGDETTPVVTGTLAGGNASTQCLGCLGSVTAGSSDGASHAWTDTPSTVSGNTLVRLYCFQIDHQVAPMPLPVMGKHVWIKTFVSTPASLSDLDAACRSDKLGSVALVGVGNAAPTDRVGATGPWTRLDGVEAISADKKKLEATINVTIGVGYVTGSVWAG